MYPFRFRRSQALFRFTLMRVSSLLIQSGVVCDLLLVVKRWATDMISDLLLYFSSESALHAFDSTDSSAGESLNSTETLADGSDAGSLSFSSHLT